MNKRVGMEGALGVGGGSLISTESQRNLEIAEDLCRKKKMGKAAPYLLEAMKDENNLDARIQFAFLLDKRRAVKELELTEKKGKQLLINRHGPKCFDDDGEQVGHFWSILDTRPYMRVLNALVRLYVEQKQYEKAASSIIEMLRLCPGDNLSNRTWLGTILMRNGRSSDALYFTQVRLRERPGPQVRGGTAFQRPHRGLLTMDVEERLTKYGTGALLYTAALASFRLWGDCPESRQYLKMAAHSNPHVLVKILGNIPRPDNLNSDPRSINGPEEAHDYLWLSQDLWMEKNVWNWVDSNKDVKELILKKCSRPECSTRESLIAEFKRCAACHRVYYCSINCQNDDWRRHKKECLAHKEQKKIMKAFQKGKTASKDSKTPVFAADFSLGGLNSIANV